MYNIYLEEKRKSNYEKMLKTKKELSARKEKHKIKTNRLSLNYQKRIKKFIIDVRIII